MMLMIRNGVPSNEVKLYGTVDPPEAIFEAAKSEGLMQQQQSQVHYQTTFYIYILTKGKTYHCRNIWIIFGPIISL